MTGPTLETAEGAGAGERQHVLILKGRFLLISRPKNVLGRINIEFPVEIGDLGSCGV